MEELVKIPEQKPAQNNGFIPDLDGYVPATEEITKSLALLNENNYPRERLSLWIDFDQNHQWEDGKKGAIDLHFGYLKTENPKVNSTLAKVANVGDAVVFPV